MSPSKREYQRVMAENLQKPDLNTTRVLSYQSKAPTAPDSHNNNLKILYSTSKTAPGSAKKSTRHIPQVRPPLVVPHFSTCFLTVSLSRFPRGSWTPPT